MQFPNGEYAYQQSGDPIEDHAQCFRCARDNVEWEENEEGSILSGELKVGVEPSFNNAGILVRRGLFFNSQFVEIGPCINSFLTIPCCILLVLLTFKLFFRRIDFIFAGTEDGGDAEDDELYEEEHNKASLDILCLRHHDNYSN